MVAVAGCRRMCQRAVALEGPGGQPARSNLSWRPECALGRRCPLGRTPGTALLPVPPPALARDALRVRMLTWHGNIVSPFHTVTLCVDATGLRDGLLQAGYTAEGCISCGANPPVRP